MARPRAACFAGWLVALAACSDAGTSGESEIAARAARGALVARVDGAAIGLEEVRELQADTGLAAREALRRLEDERLLTRAAAARGYDRNGLVLAEAKRAQVQALLALEVERGNQPDDIPLLEVKQRYERIAPQYRLPLEAFPQHERTVREQLSNERRRAALERLVARIAKSHPVRSDEREVQRLLADPKLWGGGS
jgi:hypothetical protein